MDSGIRPHVSNLLCRTSWHHGGNSLFLLDTDDIGRDILSRIIYGARISLLVGTIVVALSLGVGVILGLIAGYFDGWTESIIIRLMDIVLSLPSLLLAIAIEAILGPGLTNSMFAVAIVIMPHYVRLTRASVKSEMAKDYVIASRNVTFPGMAILMTVLAFYLMGDGLRDALDPKLKR